MYPTIIREGDTYKHVRSKDYNFSFDKTTGLMMRWGRTEHDDPPFSPIGPEILDLEISQNGCPNNCPFCYKGNTSSAPTNMSFETFKRIFNKMPKSLTQIAFGISGVQTNPDFLAMMQYARKQGCIPNFTLSGKDLTYPIARECAKVIGAVAVSAYQSDKNVCYDTVRTFTNLGITQTNIHLMVSVETLDFVYEVLTDSKSDPRLQCLNSIVFLSVKPKGRAKGHFTPLSADEYERLIRHCFAIDANIGFDSCAASKYEYAVNRMDIPDKHKKHMLLFAESCESFGIFSSYIDVNGQFYPCSFASGEPGWEEGIDVLGCEDFMRDVWFSDKLNKYRKMSMSTCYSSGCRKCLIFDEINTDPKV